MKEIRKIEKKPNAIYKLNGLGEIVEMITNVQIIDKIEKMPNREYYIRNDGCVVEKEIVKLNVDDFYQYKKDGRLAQMYREGRSVEMIQADVPLEILESFEDDYTASILENTTIDKVSISRVNGNRQFTLHLNNGKTLSLKEGLLVGGAVIEINDIGTKNSIV
jgi:hypothetical protein